jgi:hypothetical protein
MEARDSWRLKIGYPPARAGVNTGVDEKFYWHSERMKERTSLHDEMEPEPSRHRHGAKWDYH